jgi:hypothetical protein
VKRVALDTTSCNSHGKSFHASSSNTNLAADSLAVPPCVMEIDPDLIAELKYERTGEKLQNLDAKKPPTPAAKGSSSNSFKECKPTFIPHPNGNYCCVFWPDLCLYSILAVAPVEIVPPDESNDQSAPSSRPASHQKDKHHHSHHHHNTPLKRASYTTSVSSGTPLQEIERGNCVEFAWIGGSDGVRTDNNHCLEIYYLLKTPLGQKTIITQDKARRGSISSLFGGKADKISKQIIFNDLVLKELHPDRVTGDTITQLPSISVEVTNPAFNPNPTANESSAATSGRRESLNAPKIAAPAVAVPERLSLDVQQIVDIYSGLLLNMNYQIVDPSASSSAPAAAPSPIPTTSTAAHHKDNPDEIPVIEAKASLSHIYNQFFYYSSKQQKLLPVGPVMPRISCLKWDYSESFCAVQSLMTGTINVLKLCFDGHPQDAKKKSKHSSSEGEDTQEENSKQISLVTVATIEVSSFIHSPFHSWNHFHWYKGVLWVHASAMHSLDKQSNNQFSLYSFWKDNASASFALQKMDVLLEKKVKKCFNLFCFDWFYDFILFSFLFS